MLSALVFSVLFHVFLVWTIFQCCFTSPIVNGAQRFKLPSSHTPAKRLVLIVVDGLRADLLFTPNGFPDSLRYQAGSRVDVVAPHLRSIIQSRGAFGISHARVPAESIPGHVAIAAGIHEDGSEGRLWKTNSAAFDSVFNCSDRTYSFGSSDTVPMFSEGVVEGRVKEWSLSKDEEGFLTNATSLDARVFNELKTLFANATSDPKLHTELNEPKSIFFLHLPGLATTGNSYGPFSEEYMQNIIAVDNIVREVEILLRTSYNEKEGEEETAYVFTSSHGMSLAGKHGDGHPDNTRLPLVVWGKGVRGPLPDPSMLDSSSQGQTAAKTTHDRYSAPWGLGGLLRQDISQVDLAPLIATLLGIEWPKHSVGVLPGLRPLDSEPMESGFVSFVDYNEGMALAAEVNARVILEQLKAKEEHKRFMEPFYKPFAPLSSSASLSSIAAMIQQREFVQARVEAYGLIQLGLQGLRYVETYNQTLFRAMIVFTYLGWMIYVYNALTIGVSRPSESGGAQQNVVEKDTKTKSSGIAKAKASWKLVGRTLALVVCIRLGSRFWTEKAPWTYFVYVAWPCLFWGEVAGTVLSGFVLVRAPSSWVSTSVMSGLGKLRMSITSEDATKELSGEKDEVLQKLNQLDNIIKLLNEQKAATEERKRVTEKRWEEKLGRMREKERERNNSLELKQERRGEKDAFALESRDVVSELYRLMQDDIQKREERRIEQAFQPGPEKIIEELTKQNQELRDLLRSVSESWGADSERRHIDTMNAVREIAHEEIPFNLQGYLDEFAKSLASEVRILLSEVGKIREERRALQHELGYLLNIRSKYGPGGEFDPDWKPEGPPTEVPPPPPPPPPPPEHAQARPGWRQTAQSSKKKGKQRAHPPPSLGQQVPSWTQWQSESQSQPVPEFTQGSSTLFGSRKAGASRKEPTIPASSWATWQPDPRIQPTPHIESILLIPESSPGLFGPRTPRPTI